MAASWVLDLSICIYYLCIYVSIYESIYVSGINVYTMCHICMHICMQVATLAVSWVLETLKTAHSSPV